MGATTFSELIAKPDAEKVFLCEVKPGEVLTDFTLTPGEVNTYQKSYLNETITLADGSTEALLKKVVALEIDGVAMTAVGETGLTADLLDEDCSDISDWTDDDTNNGVSEADPAGQFRFDGNAANNPNRASRYIDVDLPSTFTVELETYFDLIGAVGDNDHFLLIGQDDTYRFQVAFSTTGLWIYSAGGAATEVGTNIVLSGGSAARQRWRFEVDRSGGDAAATVEVFLDTVSQGTFDCDYEPGGTANNIVLRQLGYTTANMVSHVDYIKIATGCGAIAGGYEDVEATASTYWHDTTNGILYVHTADDADPDTHDAVIAFFWVYFATRGIVLDTPARYYEPCIGQNGIQQLTQEIQPIYYGAARISSGNVVLLNGRGFFDQIADRWIWSRKEIRILLGGEDLPYSEYTALFTGVVMQTRFTKTTFTIEMQSNAFRLLQKEAPFSDFLAATWANLEPLAEGRPIPLYYGFYSEIEAPTVTCINTAYGANVYQFKICDTTYHAIQSIVQVYIDYQDGAGWQTIAHANEDLTNATFTITSATFVVGTTRVKVSFYGYHSGGTLIDGAPEIAEDLMLNGCGYVAADLNAAAFTASKTASSITLGVPVETKTSILAILQKICASDFAFIDEDGDGLIRYRTWEPTASGTGTALAKEEIMEPPEVVRDSSMLYTSVRIGYFRKADGTLYYYTETDTAAQRKYGVDETLSIDTYLRAYPDATALAAKILWFTANPLDVATLKLKATVIDKLLGDKLALTLARAPFGTAGGYAAREFEIISKTVSCFPLFVTLKAWDAGDFAGW